MLNSNNQSQNIESPELAINSESSIRKSNLVERYLSKVTSQDIEQIKIYLGVVYFVLVSIFSITLFF